MRLNRAGVLGSVAYLVVGAAWLFMARPPGPPPLTGAWLIAVAGVGLFLPGVANQVSLARAYLAAPALAYSQPGHLGLLAVAVSLAGLTDLVDGTIARRFDQPTRLGGGLDPIVDGVFLGAIAVGLALGGLIPWWLAVVVMARYLLPALIGTVLVMRHDPVELRHTLTGQVSTTLILLLLGNIALLGGLAQDPSILLRPAEVVVPVATLATFIHLGVVVIRARRPARA